MTKGSQTSTFVNAITSLTIMFLLWGWAAHTVPAETHTQTHTQTHTHRHTDTHTHTQSVYTLWNQEQSSRSSSKTSHTRGATHPEDDGVAEQQEFEQNVREPVTVSDVFVVGHRVWLRAVDRQRLPALLSTLPRCHRHHTWERALPSRIDGWMDGGMEWWMISELYLVKILTFLYLIWFMGRV